MELKFIDLGLILKADDLEVPETLQDETLFISVKPFLLALLSNDMCPIHHFGHAPDNTADGQDELLHHGTLIRIIVDEKYVGVDLECSKQEIVKAFYHLVSNYQPDFCMIMEENGATKKETTVELLYREVF
ncbi:hypothetical protein [Flavobacterium sp. TAB 87]|uniref:hypothetical protein n=1 Tax=Flavobacterium sp. TAB 87 TaxID=1729581 RepID=UPI00076D3FCC|nr:hypothetical protein [Flavobacterium sp. TAB 87]KVV16333.1 hypothetical protein AP058_00124 [Flavobacterium sp. TAB 87]